MAAHLKVLLIAAVFGLTAYAVVIGLIYLFRFMGLTT